MTCSCSSSGLCYTQNRK